MVLDPRRHLLLGEPPRSDGAEHGECAWTLLGQTMWADKADLAARCYTTFLERMPLPPWWHETVARLQAARSAARSSPDNESLTRAASAAR